MKTRSSFLAIVLACARSAHGQIVRDAVRPNPVRVSTRLQLTATVEHLSVKLGEPVVLHVRYKNVSSAATTLGALNWRGQYALTVTDFSGAEPPRTTLGESWLQEQRMWDGSSLGPRHLEPGAEGQELVIDLSKYYKLSRPGTYFVRMMFRDIWPDPGVPWPSTVEEGQKMTIEEGLSNLVQFTITP